MVDLLNCGELIDLSGVETWMIFQIVKIWVIVQTCQDLDDRSRCRDFGDLWTSRDLGDLSSTWQTDGSFGCSRDGMFLWVVNG